MGETASPSQEAIVKAIKREASPLHKAVQEGAIVTIGRGKKETTHVLSGDQVRETLLEDATRRLIEERSRLMVPDRENAALPPTEQERDALLASAEAIQADIDSEVGQRKQTYAEIAKRIGPAEVARRREKYKALAETRVEKQIAASERSTVASVIGREYKKLAQDETYAAALQKLPDTDSEGNAIKRTPKQQFVDLLASDVLDDDQKKDLRAKLRGSLDDFAHQFIGNEVVQKFKDGLAAQWADPEALPVAGGEEQSQIKEAVATPEKRAMDVLNTIKDGIEAILAKAQDENDPTFVVPSGGEIPDWAVAQMRKNLITTLKAYDINHIHEALSDVRMGHVEALFRGREKTGPVFTEKQGETKTVFRSVGLRALTDSGVQGPLYWKFVDALTQQFNIKAPDGSSLQDYLRAQQAEYNAQPDAWKREQTRLEDRGEEKIGIHLRLPVSDTPGLFFDVRYHPQYAGNLGRLEGGFLLEKSVLEKPVAVVSSSEQQAGI